jgi:porin
VTMERSTANVTSVVALIPSALSSIRRANLQTSTANGESGIFHSSSLSSKVAWAIALCLALAGISTVPTTCHAQSSTSATSEDAMTPDVSAVGKNLIEQKTMSSADNPWGPVPTKKASLANLAPVFLPFLNNGPVFGLPGTNAGDFRDRTQLSGDWGGLRTDLARHGFFFDLYTTSAFQNVASGGLKTGSASVQNTQLSINVDTGRAGLWSGGIFHFSLESRYGSSSPQNTFTAGSSVPQYTGLAYPGPFFVHDVLPTEYFLLQALTPKFAVILGKANVLTHADQTFFGDNSKYYFANLNFNKNPMALNFYNTYALAAIGIWTPSKWLTAVAGVYDPNTEANNFATKAFDHVNVYGIAIFSYKIGHHLPGQSWAQYNWTNKPKIDLSSPFGQLSPSEVPQAVGTLLGTPSSQALPINYKSTSWVTVGNFAQYLFVKDQPGAIAEKLGSGQPLRGIGLFGRIGYAPEETNPITRDASVALFANGLSDHRPNDSLGLGIYHNGISQPLKNDFARLAGATAKNEQGLEVFYDFAITPAIRLIPSYQHIWNPLTAEVAKNERSADVFTLRLSLTW